MAQLSELANQSQLSGALQDGLTVLDLQQTVTFQAYSRVVLPLDGYVFWQPTTQLVAQGSLHYAQDQVQEEDETYGLANVTFITAQQITDFGQAGKSLIYVASVDGFRYAFSQQQGFYSQAGLWHYSGKSIAPALLTQLLDQPASIDPAQAVVSNSLPLWLALNGYAPAYVTDGSAFANPVTLYPSFLTVPDLVPPYAAVHIGDEDTRPLQAVPTVDQDRNHWQLVSDRVRVTLYGLQNNAALDFVDCVMQYSLDTDNFGVMNMPVVRDAKRPQNELNAIAMKKTVEFEVSYYQARVAQVARQLILSAVPTFITGTV